LLTLIAAPAGSASDDNGNEPTSGLCDGQRFRKT
jgi:hypothetical protein